MPNQNTEEPEVPQTEDVGGVAKRNEWRQSNTKSEPGMASRIKARGLDTELGQTGAATNAPKPEIPAPKPVTK